MGNNWTLKNVKSKKPRKSPKKKISDKNKEGRKEEIAEKKKSSKWQTKKSDTKEETDEDSTLSNDGETDLQTEEPIKSKGSFPKKTLSSSSTKKKTVEYKNFSVIKVGCNKYRSIL